MDDVKVEDTTTNLERIQKALDEMLGLSEDYPNQLFDVTSEENSIVFSATSGQKFKIQRNNLSDTELSILDSEFKKCSETRMNFVYWTNCNENNVFDMNSSFDDDTESQRWDTIPNNDTANSWSVAADSLPITPKLPIGTEMNARHECMAMEDHEYWKQLTSNEYILKIDEDVLNKQLESLILKFDKPVKQEKDRKRKITHEITEVDNKRPRLTPFFPN